MDRRGHRRGILLPQQRHLLLLLLLQLGQLFGHVLQVSFIVLNAFVHDLSHHGRFQAASFLQLLHLQFLVLVQKDLQVSHLTMQVLDDRLQFRFHVHLVVLQALFERRDMPVRGNKFNGTVLLVPRVLLTSWMLLLLLFDLVLQFFHLVSILSRCVEQVRQQCRPRRGVRRRFESGLVGCSSIRGQYW